MIWNLTLAPKVLNDKSKQTWKKLNLWYSFSEISDSNMCLALYMAALNIEERWMLNEWGERCIKETVAPGNSGSTTVATTSVWFFLFLAFAPVSGPSMVDD